MFEINKVKNKMSLKFLKEKLKDYVETCECPVFSEFINEIGLLWSEWLEICENKNNVGVRLLLRYKEHLESQMEKLMVYQNKKFFNYKQLEFVLAKSNPSKYGVVKSKEEKTNNKVLNFEFGKELTNVSEIKLIEKVNS